MYKLKGLWTSFPVLLISGTHILGVQASKGQKLGHKFVDFLLRTGIIAFEQHIAFLQHLVLENWWWFLFKCKEILASEDMIDSTVCIY